MFIICGLSASAQQSLLDFNVDKNLTYKKALKLAKKENKPVLAILYSQAMPSVGTNKFSNAEEVVQRTGAIPIVIDWVRLAGRDPQRRISNPQNSTWLLIHPEDIILSTQSSITHNAQLAAFITSNQEKYDQVTEAIEQKNKKTNVDDVLEAAEVVYNLEDPIRAKELVEDYLKRINPKQLNNERFKRVIELCKKSPISTRLYRLILKQKERAIALSDTDTVHYILRANILYELNRANILDPYNVWTRYEQELDYKADSLYRIFALEYFAQIAPDKQSLYDEAFDFINEYPRADWSLLDPLYAVVLQNTTKKEDLELLQDLISFQIFRDESFRQLDYKAFIIYKLGQKERALKMISQIRADAISKGINYQSMLHSVK